MVKLYVPPPSQTVTIPSILFQIVELEDTTEDEVELEILTAAVEGALREYQFGLDADTTSALMLRVENLYPDLTPAEGIRQVLLSFPNSNSGFVSRGIRFERGREN
jgi:hypothetical protein